MKKKTKGKLMSTKRSKIKKTYNIGRTSFCTIIRIHNNIYIQKRENTLTNTYNFTNSLLYKNSISSSSRSSISSC